MFRKLGHWDILNGLSHFFFQFYVDLFLVILIVEIILLERNLDISSICLVLYFLRHEKPLNVYICQLLGIQ